MKRIYRNQRRKEVSQSSTSSNLLPLLPGASKMMRATIVVAVAVAFCYFPDVLSICPTIQNAKDPNNHCIPSVSTPTLKESVRQQMTNLNANLSSLLVLARSQPFYSTWFSDRVSSMTKFQKIVIIKVAF